MKWQSASEFGKIATLLRASAIVKGRESAKKRSDKARLRMKIFLAVLSCFLQRTVRITAELAGT